MKNESTTKTFFKFAIPSILGLLIVSMQTMIDGMFVGNFVGPKGLAAINLAMPYVNTLTSIAMMIAIGGSVVVNIQMGKGNTKKANEITSFIFISFLVIIIGLSLFSLIFIDKIVIFLGGATLFNLVKGYLFPLLLFTVFFTGPIFTETFARIGGKPNAIFLSGFTCCLSNIILDYIFIVKFGWGIEGAGWATILANLFGTMALFGLFSKGRSKIQLCKPKGDLTLLKTALYNGSSEMLSVISTAIAAFLFNRIIMEYIGELGVSALTIVFYVNNLVNITLYGLSLALQPIVSYNLGANRPDKIKEILKISLFTGAFVGISAFFIMKFNSVSLINLFTKGNIELTKLALTATSYFILAYFISFINVIASAFHTAIEKPFESALIALLRSLIFVSVFLFTLPRFFGDKGIWLAIPLSEVCCLIVSYYLTNKSIKSLKLA
ncbi:MATE family efflux transporter [Psychrilyobacter atlanticus]|uniref:MATE family efflux transporter n=1 Tax=Psychrilyobacter atlanticus TaxID=271091 RepID=UPI00040D9742|nr:MATE family efflux transporter [Psychrilyobacter atlanticus]